MHQNAADCSFRCVPRPSTFSVLPLEIAEPLRIFVGRAGEEVVEFSWSTLILDVLVEGVITLHEGRGMPCLGFHVVEWQGI